MQKLFNKILVPVDFSSKSKSAIEKAVEISTRYNCSIYLLHVVTASPFELISITESPIGIPYHIIDKNLQLEFQLEKQADFAKRLAGDSIKIGFGLTKGSWDKTIIDLVNEQKFDLVLIGQKRKIMGNRNMLINPDKIAVNTNIPVITVPSNPKIASLYSIVIPITDYLPVRKLMYGIYIAAGNNTSIKLLGIENEQTREKVQYYIAKAYRLIRDNCNVKVELETMFCDNVADAVNKHSILKSGGMVILNPGAQTKMRGLFASLIGCIVHKYSMPPILTVTQG